MKRKLIEVSLPLEAINKQAAREKSIRHGHPSTLHLWWARRPLAAARAVLFAQLVDDPSARPDEFPTEEDQRVERDRLHGIIQRLADWDFLRDERLLAQANTEILKSTAGVTLRIQDVFAGGGTIPLAAVSLGLDVVASDLNPVAVLINKALIDLPVASRDQPPVFPGLSGSQIGGWKDAAGLAADVRGYGLWMRDEALSRLRPSYPDSKLSDGSTATTIAWIWARTVTCPNPMCGISVPLARSWWLGKKKGKEAYVVPKVVPDSGHPSGRAVRFSIGRGTDNAPSKEADGSVKGRAGATCVACDTHIAVAHLRAEGKAGRLGTQMLAVVAEGFRQRHYLEADETHLRAAEVDEGGLPIPGTIADNPRWFSPPAYGLTAFTDLYTKRQLATLRIFSDLVSVACSR